MRIPEKNKKFVVDNASMSRGNIYSTWNVMFDADVGKIKLNPPIVKTYSSTNDSDFSIPYAMLTAPADLSTFGTASDFYILTTDDNGFGGVWGTLGGLTKLTGANSPSLATESTSDMALYLGAQTTEKLYVSTSAGLHWVKPTESRDAWGTLLTTDAYKNNFILVPFTDTNRLYMFKSTGDSITSVQETADGVYSLASSGAYTITSGLSGITCARASAKRIWFASSNTPEGKSKVYEWDGVSTNPLNIHVLDIPLVQSMFILNDLPVLVDGRGRLWFYDGYTFKLKDGVNLPAREDDFNRAYVVHRNGTLTDKGKGFILAGSISFTDPNTSERGLAGMWCYDPNIGLYHHSSPDNLSRITIPYALAKRFQENVYALGYAGSTVNINAGSFRVSLSDTTSGLNGSTRIGFITTQFIESKNLTDTFNTIALKYRKMIDPDAQIEVKYRMYKNIECNTTATWTSATTFTCSTADLAGDGFIFNSQVVVGDEVMVQMGNNVGTIAHITNIGADISGTTIVTIDRSVTTTSGTSYVMISNFKLLDTITTAEAFNFKNIRLGEESTMLQVKVVMAWKGYFDELQEIVVPEQKQQTTT